MKVLQILPTISYGDGVSNDCLAIGKALKERGIQTGIYALEIDSRLKQNSIQKLNMISEVSKDDILIYHLSSGNEWNYRFPELPGKKILRYHNITPASFFQKYNTLIQKNCDYGRASLLFLRDKVDYLLPVSKFNESELRRVGYKQPSKIMPILIPFKDYDRAGDEVTEKGVLDGKDNILFTGRIAPNKCQQDVIKVFWFYHKYFNADSRLILAGSWNGLEKYYHRLWEYTRELNIEKEVCFTGHIHFEKLLSYYRTANFFVCMSKHEGFCIPLVEAMKFQLPIIAYDCSAISTTMGNGGVLLKEKNYLLAAMWLDQLKKNKDLLSEIMNSQKKQLELFQYDNVKEILYHAIKEIENLEV